MTTDTQHVWSTPESTIEPMRRYEDFFVPTVFGPFARRLVTAADLETGQRVLDAACGTGIVARYAAPLVGQNGRVVGIDINPGMLAVARQASSGMRPEIEWEAGDISALPFPDDSFDHVFCQQGLQFVPDQAAALKELRRVLVSDGRLALSVWRPLRYLPTWLHLADAYERNGCPDVAAFFRRAVPDLSYDDLRAVVANAGFADVHVHIDIGQVRFGSVPELVRQWTAAIPLRETLDSLSEQAYEALVQDFRSAIRDYTDDTGVVGPAEALVARAHR